MYLFELFYELIEGYNLISDDTAVGNLSQGIKLFRIFVVLYREKKMPEMRIITKSFFKTVSSAKKMLTILIFIYITASIVSMELFAYKA